MAELVYAPVSKAVLRGLGSSPSEPTIELINMSNLNLLIWVKVRKVDLLHAVKVH